MKYLTLQDPHGGARTVCLVRELGDPSLSSVALNVTHYTCSVADIGVAPAVIMECTRTGQVIAESMCKVGASGAMCPTALDTAARCPSWAVLKSSVVIGSVNANKRRWYKGAEALARADSSWLGRMIKRRYKPQVFAQAPTRHSEEIKVIIRPSEVWRRLTPQCGYGQKRGCPYHGSLKWSGPRCERDLLCLRSCGSKNREKGRRPGGGGGRT
jgi:hypothetical protein